MNMSWKKTESMEIEQFHKRKQKKDCKQENDCDLNDEDLNE